MTRIELVKFLEDFPDDYKIFFYKEASDKLHLVATNPECVCNENGCFTTFVADIDILEEIPYKECD